VAERGVLAGLAPSLGAQAGLFMSDERTGVYLRDQRRSKAHRALAPDPGAHYVDSLHVDLGGVDPLLSDASGTVRPVRELAGEPVSQVLLGGDTGATLRDLLAVAALLKSKRAAPGLDFLLAVPSRQMLEVLASTGALTDLVNAGARLVEPDSRLLSGRLYPPASRGLSLRSFGVETAATTVCVASAETLAAAVASGHVGDPRTFRRPVRVLVPRTLPTDDVLVTRALARGGRRGVTSTRASGILAEPCPKAG
jgi:aconitate hydratase